MKGAGPPKTTGEFRRTSLRATRLTAEVWGWALLGGGLGVVALEFALRMASRMIMLPLQPIPDLSHIPNFTIVSLLLFGAPVAGIVEESAFRGYMQGPIERHYGLSVAILVTGTMFAVAAIYGIVTYLTKSILPDVVLLTAGNIFSNHELWLYGQAEWQAASSRSDLVWRTGADTSCRVANGFLFAFAAASTWTCMRLARTAHLSPLH